MAKATGVLAIVLITQLARAVVVAPEERTEARRWVAAKFEGVTEVKAPEAGLLVLAQHDPRPFRKDKNPLSGKPLKLSTQEYAHGLFAHAPSKVMVYLPGPGKTFTALVGVDSNEETDGGQGSVIFSVSAGGKEAFRSDVRQEGMPGAPVAVDLNGATQFALEVGDAGNSHAKDQAAWFDAKVVLEDGRALWLGELPTLPGLSRGAYNADPPFSFRYDGKPSAQLLPDWELKRDRRALDAHRTEHTLTYTEAQGSLVVRCVAVEYHDYPTVEWTLYFKNGGSGDSPILSEIQALDTRLERGGGGEFVLHHQTGSPAIITDFQPLETVLHPKQTKRITTSGGRPSNSDLPYFNIAWAGEGVIMVVGWPGQWAAQFARDELNGLRLIAGQELTHLKLKPGEEIRTPLMVLQFWKGDWIRAQNIWRRWMMAHNLPKSDGQPLKPTLFACSSHQFGEMINANEANQKLFVDRYLEEGLKIDYWWMDAGWYVNQTGWPNTGTWEVDTKRFPRGLRAVSDHAHAKGVKILVWFEPERVTPGTWLYEQNPEWLLGRGPGQKLLDLGNPQARQWLTDHVDCLLTEQGIDLYRQDFNMDPLSYWRENDAPDRQGITEIGHVTGYLAYWDELVRRHPKLLLDTCASGGRRIDLETLRRSVPRTRSDYLLEPVGEQSHTHGLALWVPYFGSGYMDGVTSGRGPHETYLFRSFMYPVIISCIDVRRKDVHYELIRHLVAQWRKLSPYMLGDYYPLTPFSTANDAWLAWQFDCPERGEGMVQAFRRAESSFEVARWKLRGLEPDARYAVANVDLPGVVERTGRQLMEHGLQVQIEAQPGAVILTYQRLKANP